MSKGLIGRKIGMTQVFDADGNVSPVTVIQAGPCTVVRKKSESGSDGYAALLLGFEDVRSAEVDGETVFKATKPALGVFKSAGIDAPKRHLREIRIDEADLDKYEVGAELDAGTFNPGEEVDVTATSKGRGFAGVMKRHNMSGFRATHGTHEVFRHGGSIGTSATPSRVYRGVRMAGQLGNARVTVQNIKVLEVDKDNGVILLKGSVPGPNGGLVVVRDAVKRRRRTRLIG